MSGNTLLLLDGSSLAFRSFYAIQDLDSFTNRSGLHTNALYSFHRMLTQVLDRFDPSHVLVAFDLAGPTFRTQAYADYKGGRQSTPEEFKEQMPYFRVMLDAFGIVYHSLADYEADDIIGTLSRQVGPGDRVVIITGDKDLIQLANDQTTVYITRKGVSQLEAYTPAVIQEKYGLSPEQIIDMKALMGDSSDNYPGVTRVGEKTALKYLHTYGSLDQLYDHIDDFKPSKAKDNLIQDKDLAYQGRFLAEIVKDLDLDISLEDLAFSGEKNLDQLVEFYREMDFKVFMEDLYQEGDLQAPTLETDPLLDAFQYSRVHDITADILPDQGAYLTENLQDNYHQDQVVAVAWLDPQGKQAYVADWDLACQSADFRNWLADPEKKKVVHDLKRERVLAQESGLETGGFDFDLVLANYLVDTQNSPEIPDMLAYADLPVFVHRDEEVYGKGAKLALPEDPSQLDHHLAHKALALWLLKEPYQAQLKALDMETLYTDMEHPLAHILADMELRGIRVNGEVLLEKNEELLARLERMEEEIHQLAGETFNVNSPKQLGEVLFEKLGLPVIKKTKTGYSTAAGVLEKLLDKHPIIAKVLDYRQVAKLQNTYVSSLPEYIQEDGKIHTRFVQTLTQTGRLSSADPNLQNIPIRIEEGRRVREAFIPSQEGWQLFGADYSQIELRVLAHISGDKHMQADFAAGRDIHEATAHRVFSIPEDQAIDANLRRQAKAVNFGIVYGISDYGLSQNLNISRKQAQKYIDIYFERYSGIADYMDWIVKESEARGYVKTLFNRRRYLPDLKSSNYNIRNFAQRTAINTPIQGTAADILKRAMIKIQATLEEQGLASRMLLQIHDEVILEGPSEEMEILADLIPDLMVQAADLDVPLEVDFNQGNNWYEL